MKTKEKTKIVYIGIILGTLVALLFMMPVFYIKTVDVINNDFYSDEEIIEISNIQGKHILNFSYEKAKQNIRELPYINSVSLKCIFPGKVEIVINESRPFAYVEFSGTYLCLDKNGVVIEQSSVMRHELPILEGIIFDGFSANEPLEIGNMDNWICATQVIEYLEKHKFIQEITKIDVYNIQEIHLYVNKLDAIMGNIGGFDKKIESLIRIHEEYDMGTLDFSPYLTRGEIIFKPIT